MYGLNLNPDSNKHDFFKLLLKWLLKLWYLRQLEVSIYFDIKQIVIK